MQPSAKRTISSVEMTAGTLSAPQLAPDLLQGCEFQRHAKLRHASLFAGSVRGAERWATLLGVVRTAQKCGVDVEAYLGWLFEHQGTHRERLGRSPAQLTPMAYRAWLDEQGARAA